MIVNIYCPKCNAKGRKKIIGKTNTNAKGTIYLWCKSCKKEIEIQLDNLEPRADNK